MAHTDLLELETQLSDEVWGFTSIEYRMTKMSSTDSNRILPRVLRYQLISLKIPPLVWDWEIKRGYFQKKNRPPSAAENENPLLTGGIGQKSVEKKWKYFRENFKRNRKNLVLKMIDFLQNFLEKYFQFLFRNFFQNCSQLSDPALSKKTFFSNETFFQKV